MNNDNEASLREEIAERISRICALRKENEKFIPGLTRINYAGRVYDEKELTAAVNSVLDFRLTLGEKSAEFIGAFKTFMGVDYGLVTNSGSSANLIAVSSLCSPNVSEPLKPGDEVVTAALAFPTTVNPIIQNGLVPVFADIDRETYNIDPESVEEAISDKTRAVMFAHTLGNPADMDRLVRIAQDHRLYLIEDTCDALGAKFDGRLCGTFGDFSTFSFYPAHHITMGEGGALITSSLPLYRNAISIRDWGRACFCEHGDSTASGACKNRFGFKFEGLPEGYDHRYIYSNIGYNLKPLDVSCAIGSEQLKKLPAFIEKRNENFSRLYGAFKKHEEYFILPKIQPLAEPSWFGIPIAVREKAGFDKRDFVMFLESRNIETRMLFAGNLLRHPGYRHIRHRIASGLRNTDAVMNSAFFLGVYPGLTGEKLDYIISAVDDFINTAG